MKKILLISLGALVLLAVISVVCINIAMDSYTTYETEITDVSPDGKREIIIREFDTLGGSGADILLKNGSEKVKKRIAFDDYYKPFKEENYNIHWEEEKVLIKYYSGADAQSANDVETWSEVFLSFENK